MDAGNPRAGTAARPQAHAARQEPYHFRTWDQRPGTARELRIADLSLKEFATLLRLGLRPSLLQP